MKQKNLSLREELMHLKITLKDEMLKRKKLDSTLEQILKENAELKIASIHKEEITNSHRGKRKNRLRPRRIGELYASKLSRDQRHP